jgi:hypothetical protein
MSVNCTLEVCARKLQRVPLVHMVPSLALRTVRISEALCHGSASNMLAVNAQASLKRPVRRIAEISALAGATS